MNATDVKLLRAAAMVLDTASTWCNQESVAAKWLTTPAWHLYRQCRDVCNRAADDIERKHTKKARP